MCVNVYVCAETGKENGRLPVQCGTVHDTIQQSVCMSMNDCVLPVGIVLFSLKATKQGTTCLCHITGQNLMEFHLSF